MTNKSKNYKFIAGLGAILSLGIAVFYYFYAQDAEMWEKWLPVGLFLLVAIIAFIRYRKL